MATDTVQAGTITGAGSIFAGDNETVGTDTVVHPLTKIEWGAEDSFTLTNTGTASLPMQGAAAEDAAVAANPVLSGGRYDTTDRTLDDGDVGAIAVDAAGYVKVNEPNAVDSNNSSTSTLAGDATYTGTGTDVLAYRNVVVSVFADQASATSGLAIQFSSDNSNWDFTESFTVSASTGETHMVPVRAQYFRVTYTNGSTPQGAFRLQTVLSKSDLTGVVTALDTTVGSGDQALLTRSVLSADNGTAFTNIAATAGGNLKVSLQEASDGLDIGAGNAGTETIRVSVASDDVNLSGILADTANMDTNLTTVAGAVSGSEMQVDVVGALPAGTNAIGKLAANSGVDIGDVDVTSLPQPSNHYRNIDANAEAAIKGSAGTLYWVHVMNLTASLAYLHLYDATTGNVTPGSTTPDFTFPIPTQGDTNGAGFAFNFGPGQSFTNAITLVVTTTTDGSAGDPGTNGVFVNAGYE